MTKYYKTIIVSSLLPLVLGAVSLPQVSSKPLLNLQHYLEYNFENNIEITCKNTATKYICQSDNQSVTKTDENNVTSTFTFKTMQLHFNFELSTQLAKATFEKTIKEIKHSEEAELNELKNPMGISTSLQDTLDRALFNNLTHMSLDDVDIKNSEPKSHITVKNIAYSNSMKSTAKNASFNERIFGDIELSYTQALFDANNSVPFYQNIPAMLESWFETHNEQRANYVSKKLHELYINEAILPVDGMVVLSTKYLGNDSIAVTIKATNNNYKSSSGSFRFSGEIRNASAVFQAANSKQGGGMPDFLFQALELNSYNKADNYRHLINNDKKLATYVNDYTKLIGEHFDEKVQAFTSNAKLVSWFEQAKLAFSKIIQGEADKLDMSIVNKSGATAMQLFSIVMGKMMQEPKKGEEAPNQESIIADIVTEQLELKINATKK